MTVPDDVYYEGYERRVGGGGGVVDQVVMRTQQTKASRIRENMVKQDLSWRNLLHRNSGPCHCPQKI